jgi:hypothetical protein
MIKGYHIALSGDDFARYAAGSVLGTSPVTVRRGKACRRAMTTVIAVGIISTPKVQPMVASSCSTCYRRLQMQGWGAR